MKQNPHRQFPGKMDKSNKRTYKLSFKMGYGKLKHVKLFENFDNANENFTEFELEKIKEVIKKNTLSTLEKPLEELGFKVRVSTFEMGLPPMIIEVSKSDNDKNRAVILNREYVDGDADFVHDKIAMGIMECSMINEATKKLRAVSHDTVPKAFYEMLKEIISTSTEIEKELPKYEAVTNAVSEKIKKLDEEYKAKKKAAEDAASAELSQYKDKVEKLKTMKAEALEKLSVFGVSTFRIKDISVEIQNILISKGVYNKDGSPKTTYNWKDIAELNEKLVPVNEANKKALAQIKEANKNQKLDAFGPDIVVSKAGKVSESLNEGLLDWIKNGFNKAVKWTKDFFGGVIGVTPELEAATADAEDALAFTKKLKAA